MLSEPAVGSGISMGLSKALAVSMALLLVCGFAGSAYAKTASSPSFMQLGGSFASSASPDLADSHPSANYQGGGGTLGEGIPVSMVGSTSSLETLAPGFWAIVVGEFADLDADGDGIQSFLDDDDDNDGLLDDVETGTGYFVDEMNTGTSPNLADTDGDGFDDGQEVQLGFDPNDPESFPMPAVPALSWVGWALLVMAMMIGTALRVRARRIGQRL